MTKEKIVLYCKLIEFYNPQFSLLGSFKKKVTNKITKYYLIDIVFGLQPTSKRPNVFLNMLIQEGCLKYDDGDLVLDKNRMAVHLNDWIEPVLLLVEDERHIITNKP